MHISNLIKDKVFKNINKKEINAIVLYGSRSRGDYYEDSDYDLNVYLNNNSSKESREVLNIPEKEIWISIINKRQFKELKSKGHPFLYCAFRDGKSIYQKNKWFDKLKPEILKLKPSKKIIFYYLSSALEISEYLTEKIKKRFYSSLVYEDSKVVANKLGFAMLMKKNIYPTSPHTLKRELIKSNNKNKKIANTIEYLQKVYYNNKKPKIKKYRKELNRIHSFMKKYVSTNFKNNLRHLS